MTLKVAMLTLYPLDETQVRGGIRMVSLNLVQALGHMGDLDLHVIHCHGDCKETRTERRYGATIHYLATPRRHVFPNLTSSVKDVSRFLARLSPDVAHAHVGHLAYAGVRVGVPTIYTIHGVLAREREIYSQKLYDRLRYGLLDFYERRALPRVTRLVAISDHVRQAYEERRSSQIIGVPWSHIDNPVAPEFFAVQDTATKPTVLYVGSITEIKDLYTLLRAVDSVRQHVPEIRLRIAGRITNEAYWTDLQERIRDMGLEAHVEYLGLLSREKLLAEYSRASLVALSSLQENAPMAIIEAMAAGKPVVATAVGGVPGLVREGETGSLVGTGDHDNMALKMQRILQDDLGRRAMAHRAREVARERFGAGHVAASYLALYEQVASERAA